MRIKTNDRFSLAEAYNKVQECECQHMAAQTNAANSSDERTDMVLNNLVNLNNKAAELVSTIQTAVDSGEGIDEWVSEKIAVAASMIGSINDYYTKFKTTSPSKIAMPSMNQSPMSNTIAVKIPMGSLDSSSMLSV